MKVKIPPDLRHRNECRAKIRLPNIPFTVGFDFSVQIDEIGGAEEWKDKFLHVDVWTTRFGLKQLLKLMLANTPKTHYVLQGIAKQLAEEPQETEQDMEKEYETNPTTESEE